MYILLALAAYILFAAATLTDKYLLNQPIPSAGAYSFYIGIMGLFSLFLIPFGFYIPQGILILLSIFAGAIFLSALFLFFVSIRRGEVSRVGISVGGLIPMFTLAFVYVSAGDLPDIKGMAAFSLLLLGSLIVVLERVKGMFENLRQFLLILSASALFGLYFTIAKFLFNNLSFINAFVWIKIGAAMFALLFLLSADVRKILFQHKKEKPKKIAGIFLAKNAAGGIAELLRHLAISLAKFGEVALVNALQGAQFALVFFGAVFLSKKFPEIVKEGIGKRAMVVKFLGTGFVVLGIIMLAI